MAVDFKTRDECAAEYLANLDALKPGLVNIDQTDSEWYIKSQINGAILSGVYADQRLIANDAFVQNARTDAVSRHLQTWLNRTFLPATVAVGSILVLAPSGTDIPVNSVLSYLPNGNTYQTTKDVNTGTSATGAIVPIQSVGTGQAQNLLAGAVLTFTSPPSNITAAATAYTNIADGTDTEANSQAAAAVLNYIQQPPAGGNANDYSVWAIAAGAVTANTIRFPFGLGSVGVVITAGTTNIDEAIDAGDAVVQIPSAALIAQVQAYIQAQCPFTDCPFVLPPTAVSVPVTVYVTYPSGQTGSTILANQTLTNDQLVQREVSRAIYKTPPGGRQAYGMGWVLASEIEDTIDVGLSAGTLVPGVISLLSDRRVDNLFGATANFPLLPYQIPVPGVITVVSTGPVQ